MLSGRLAKSHQGGRRGGRERVGVGGMVHCYLLGVQ